MDPDRHPLPRSNRYLVLVCDHHVDAVAWTQTTLLEGDLATADPATLNYRLLHVAARIARGQRRLFIRIDSAWPCRQQLAAAFSRLHALPQPIT